jgi:hypothetical protein
MQGTTGMEVSQRWKMSIERDAEPLQLKCQWKSAANVVGWLVLAKPGLHRRKPEGAPRSP